MPQLLKLPSLERKPKAVKVAASWHVTVPETQQIKDALNTITEAVATGKILPPRFYRKRRESTRDRLLQEHGIMHLHLGDPDTRELLFLKQYDTHVYLLCTTEHYPFEEDPPGTTLLRRHRSANETWEAEADAEAAPAAGEKRRLVRRGLLPRKAKP